MSLASGYRSNPWRLVSVRDDGLLTLEALHSRCERLDHIEADESAADEDVVVAAAAKEWDLPAQRGEESGQNCAAELMYGIIKYPLRWPLGSRRLVHAAFTNKEEWSLLGPEFRGRTPAPQPGESAPNGSAPKPSLRPGYRSNPWRLVSVRDDSLLTLEARFEGCEIFKRVAVDESDAETIVITAVVKIWIPPPDRADEPHACDSKFQHTATYRLRRPLGSRKLVHAAVTREAVWDYLEPQYWGTTTPAQWRPVQENDAGTRK
jgi:hypothetical protein